MLKLIEKLEKGVVYALLGMMTLVVLIETIDLGWIIIKDIISPPFLLLEVHEIMEIFGFFLLVLIGLELLESIRIYLIEGAVHVVIVLEVALIAIARKVIILDIEKYASLTLVGFAALLLAVAVAFHFIKRYFKKPAD